MKTNKLEIKNGKFYRNGVEEKPEIGNVEQIKALREHEHYISQYHEGFEIEPEFEIRATVTERCLCGNFLNTTEDVEDDEDIHPFDDKKLYCRECGRIYTLYINGDELWMELKSKK